MDQKNDLLIERFARALQLRRRECGLSQEELAHLAGLSTSYMSLLETRKRQPTLSALGALANALDLSLLEFMGMIGEDDG
ncbi:helix-turn-helix domain-containing protein [Planktotalea sp.]|uniref:helix-turn-helix domain-containing protein n=1 Tax=Planktotalea sp. TaxID=2029877 RepID=UPI003F6D9474